MRRRHWASIVGRVGFRFGRTNGVVERRVDWVGVVAEVDVRCGNRSGQKLSGRQRGDAGSSAGGCDRGSARKWAVGQKGMGGGGLLGGGGARGGVADRDR